MKNYLLVIGILTGLILTVFLTRQSNRNIIEDAELISNVNINDETLLKKIPSTTNISNSRTTIDEVKSKVDVKKELPTISEEITVEQAFLVNGKGVSLEFLKNIDDYDIFSTAIDSLREESQNNTKALENKNYYENLALNLANKHLAENEDYDFELNDIQCGEKTCLFSSTSNNNDMWERFKEDLTSTENGVFTAAHRSYVDDYGNTHYNSFISVDESINSIVSTEPLNTISLSNGTVINLGEPDNDDGGG